MELSNIMQKQRFAVAGDTLNPEKYACRIKEGLRAAGYDVWGVGKELPSLNDLPEGIEILDLCIHPVKGLALLQACTRSFDCIVVQPGAESEELLAYLQQTGRPYLESCLLIGLREYPRSPRG